MTSKVARDRSSAKSERFQIRNQTAQIRNRISPVMAKVRELLPQAKAAHHLSILIDEPLGNCQKLLSGHRSENSDVLAKLLRSAFGREVLFALMGDARPEWFSKYQKQLDVNAARKKLIETQREIEALQQGLIE
ncbi:hypothetical protein HL667_33630 [Bradyrhizobium sp. 83012]|uniref:Transcriptional regulator n=1 Tax=Bradyrhizobium aeschynomenes TaxID=2734909 RepID=A0ABX2CPS7_9BRAD|nr:hypothetical protein [Bradyrhizobium aeschynomenes]NPU69973.1 hypothetical protein [Bradyrhizobium aeschynomenes]